MAEILFPRVREYKDISLSFTRNPVTDDIVSIRGEDAVRRSIKNLLSIFAGEVPFFPNLGTRLHGLLFEPIDPVTTALLESEIRDTIDAFEPRAKVETLVVTPSEDEHKYQIDVTFSLLNLTEPVTLTLFLSRLR